MKLAFSRYFTILIFLLGMPSDSRGLGKSKEAYPLIGWVELLAFPEKFDGKNIQLTGFIFVVLRGNSADFALYMSTEALKYADVTQAIDLDPESLSKLLPQPRETWQLFHGEYVRLQGKFEVLGKREKRKQLSNIEMIHQEKPGPPIFVDEQKKASGE